MKKLKVKSTTRGFPFVEFNDQKGVPCSIQISSLADDRCIWVGIDKVKALVMARDAAQCGIDTEETTGWVPFPIPDVVMIPVKMHLNIDQVKALIPVLKKFVETGELE